MARHIYTALRVLTMGALLLTTACTLAFDTDSVKFEEKGLTNNNGFLNNGANNGPTNNGSNNGSNGTNNGPGNNGVGNNGSNNGTANNGTNNMTVVPGLAAYCGASDVEGCLPGEAAWPRCLTEQCREALGKTGECVRNTSLHGYCSPMCATDADCYGNRNNSFVASLRCVTNGGATGLCLPGSQDRCASDTDCEGGEVCKLSMQPGPQGMETRRACQTPTQQGAVAGEYCNEDRNKGRLQRCKNDLCVDDICSALCPENGGEEPGYCGSANLTCQEVDPVGVGSMTICSPRSCLSASDCSAERGQPAYCYPAFLTDGGFGGLCRTDNPEARGSAELGESCSSFGVDPDESLCASRFCTGYEPNLFCSTLCDSDADCSDDQVCDVSRYRVGESEFYARVCSYARGSAAECDGQSDCFAGEFCAPYLFGEVTPDGQGVLNPRATGLCVQAVAGGVARGAACGDSGCSVYGACVLSEGTAWCSNVCLTSLDCPDGFGCYPIEMLSGEDNASWGGSVNLGWCAP